MFVGNASLVFIGLRVRVSDANRLWLSKDSEEGIEVAPILWGVDCAKKSLALIEE